MTTTQETLVELKPCPICGSAPVRNGRGKTGGVVCASTGLLDPRPSHRVQTYGAGQAEADTAWNTRSTPPIDDITYAGSEPVGPLLIDPTEPTEGWRLVPVEPTEAMLDEAGGVSIGVLSYERNDDWVAMNRDEAREVWSAMLKSSPDYKGGER